MSLSSVSIRRPVFTSVLMMVILLFGGIAFFSLGIREYPSAERPVISVRASYPGAGPSVIESQITEPLEEEINTVSGIKTLTAISREGRSSIIVEFNLGYDLDVAANDVRDRVSSAIGQLPDDAEPPIVVKADADGDPIVFLNISSPERSLLQLTDIADRLFKSRLQTIEGVAQIDIWGDKEYAMRIWLDPNRLAAVGLTPIDVRNAIRAANVELPSGRIEASDLEISVRTLSRIAPLPENFEQIRLKSAAGGEVTLGDIGRVEIGPLNERTILKRDGIPMVGVVIRPQVGANEIAIVDEFYRRVEEIKKDLPEDIQLGLGFDTSEFVRNSIKEVKQTIFIALFLVCLTIFLFLREIRSALIPLITIPIALIGAFFVMDLAGFTLNVLTLLGLVLAIGLVVDDAVIVLENIYSKIEEGEEPIQAALKGIKEIFLAVIATTLALVAVFMPLLFLGGLTGVLFREFGLTLAGAVVISSFIALTLTPMLSSRLLKSGTHHNFFYQRTEPFFRYLINGYRATLDVVFANRWVAALLFAGSIGSIVLLERQLPRELAPTEDRGLLVVSASGPEGANFDYMSKVMNEIGEEIAGLPEREAFISVTSPGFGASSTTNSGFARLVLVPKTERERSSSQIAGDLSRRLQSIPGADVFIREPATLRAGGRGLPVQFVVQNPDFSRLREILPQFLSKARESEVFRFVDVNLKFNRPEVRIEIDRDRANDLGIPVRNIAETIQAALAEQRFGTFLLDGKQYQIVGQLERRDRNAPLDLAQITVRTPGGQTVTLDNLVQLSEATSPAVLYRYNRFASATFSASLNEGFTVADGITAIQAVADEILDSTFTTELSGQSREFMETGQSLFYVFILALLLVYLVLAAQFESFRSPLIIMLTVPLALAGGFFALWYFDQTLNIFSQIGLIMLIGLITKNGILIVEFANQRYDRGMSPLEAVKGAAAARFRPILMTAISTILGTLPIALAFGAGSQSRMPLGIAVIGGLILGSFLTLYVIPIAYQLIKPEQQNSAAHGSGG